MAHILLIDDMKGVRDSLDMILSTAGHTIDQAEDGPQGIEMMEKSKYDLIITDIIMPHIDGTELVFKTKEVAPNIPVLAISAGLHGVKAKEALSVAAEKADAVLEKPFSKSDFLGAVNQLIG